MEMDAEVREYQRRLREEFSDWVVFAEADYGCTISAKLGDRAFYLRRVFRPERDGVVGFFVVTEETLNRYIELASEQRKKKVR
jgi:hypothetical protein